MSADCATTQTAAAAMPSTDAKPPIYPVDEIKKLYAKQVIDDKAQQHGIIDEKKQLAKKTLPNGMQLSDTAKTPRMLALAAMSSFNADDFLARVNMNEKINNILRSPNTTPNGVRQRSVYTTITPTPRYTGVNLAYNSGQRAIAGGHSHSHSHSGSAGIMSSKEATTAVPSAVTSANLPPPHPLQMSMHLSAASPHYPNAYEAPIATRSANLARGVLNTTRYKPITKAALTPQVYTFDNELRMKYTKMMPQTHQLSPHHHSQQFPQPMPPPPFVVSRLNSNRGHDYEKPNTPACPGAGPIVMTNGTIQLRLRDGVRIDMTIDKAVRIVNQRSMVAIALSRNCGSSAVIHPNGRVLQSGSKVEIVTYDGMKTNNFVRYAKMWYKGVSFTSESCALIYLVDTAGTRTTTDAFTDLTKDYTLTVFYDESRHGPSFVNDANDIIASSSYSCSEDGSEVYEVNGFRITQAADGLVKLTRNHNKCLIRTSPGNGSATLTTPGIHCTASLGKTSHLFVRRNEKRMHFDGSSFIVRNAGHSAGFNENNLLIVY